MKIGTTSSKAREALAQYLARPPVSLKKMLVEKHRGSVLYLTEYKENTTHYPRPGASVQFALVREKHELEGRTLGVLGYMHHRNELHLILALPVGGTF